MGRGEPKEEIVRCGWRARKGLHGGWCRCSDREGQFPVIRTSKPVRSFPSSRAIEGLVDGRSVVV